MKPLILILSLVIGYKVYADPHGKVPAQNDVIDGERKEEVIFTSMPGPRATVKKAKKMSKPDQIANSGPVGEKSKPIEFQNINNKNDDGKPKFDFYRIETDANGKANRGAKVERSQAKYGEPLIAVERKTGREIAGAFSSQGSMATRALTEGANVNGVSLGTLRGGAGTKGIIGFNGVQIEGYKTPAETALGDLYPPGYLKSNAINYYATAEGSATASERKMQWLIGPDGTLEGGGGGGGDDPNAGQDVGQGN